jgi:hypothetical protein
VAPPTKCRRIAGIFFSRNTQAGLRALREPDVHVGGGLKQLDSFHDGIALASARQFGGFGLEPEPVLFQALLE